MPGPARSIRWCGSVGVVVCALVLAPRIAAAPPQGSDAVVPFTIRVPNDVLVDLKHRLSHPRFPDELSGAAWDYGTNLEYLRGLVAYWRDRFDWRAQERRLNQLPQFKTNVDGLDIHFAHRRSTQPGALPLVMIHGWPGSFLEFVTISDYLADPVAHGGRAEDAFHVVAVSLPGYGFSDKPRDRGFSPERMARAIATVMSRLGYTRYGVQGGDWGSVVGRMMAVHDEAHVAGLHANFCTQGPPPGTADPNAGVDPDDLQRVRQRQASMQNELAYFQIQSTKPQTLAYGLNDSPIGLAAWIVEKFRSWCDCDGDVEKKFTKDDLLTNITLYWATQSIASSTRIYYENQRAATPLPRVEVPMACALFPKDIVFSTRRWTEAQNNLVRWTVMPRGGHFAAMEEPDLLARDIREFFRSLR